MKISFLCFDLSDNSLGRAALLAQALAAHHTVELVGPAKKGEIWYPLRDLDIPVRTYAWKRYPAFVPIVRRMVKELDADLVFACKLRPTSFGIGLLRKWIYKTPLLVDIDDWELGFFYHTDFWGKLGRFLNLSNPNGLPYTWLMERWVRCADGISVSNRYLQNRFSGTLLYHCRDTAVLDPALYDAEASRQALHLAGKKVVMFLGTPRAHKGVDDLVRAVETLGDPMTRLVIVGADETDKARILARGGDEETVRFVPRIPFAKLGEYLAAADVVAIPQRRTTDTVGQMPAKIFDAMAMARPIVSTRVSDIPEVLDDCGHLVEPGDIDGLAAAIRRVLSDPVEAQAMGERARRRCRDLYDTRRLTTQLNELVASAVSKQRPGENKS